MVHAEALVGLLGDGVGALDVEAYAADVAAAFGHAEYVVVHCAIDTLAPPCCIYMDALNPPVRGVAPVAPLVSHEQAADDLLWRIIVICACHCDDVEALLRIVEYGGYALQDGGRVECSALGLDRHRLLELGDAFYVCSGCVAGAYVHNGIQFKISALYWKGFVEFERALRNYGHIRDGGPDSGA